MEDDYNPSEKAVKIVEKIKEMTGIPAIFIDRKPNTVQPSLTDSKFGGLPYWDMEKEYPTDSKGEKMMLLAQINFSDLCAFDTELPKEGMLQFFITVDDDVFGMDFDDPVSQKDFRVVFHDTVRQDVTEEQVQTLNIVRAEEADDYSTPIFHQAALSFRTGIDYMSSIVFPIFFIFSRIKLDKSWISKHLVAQSRQFLTQIVIIICIFLKILIPIFLVNLLACHRFHCLYKHCRKAFYITTHIIYPCAE